MGASQERGIRAWRSVVYLIEVWGVIVAAVALVVWQPTWWAALIAAPIIAGRQHALLIVEHECWHFNLFENRRLNNIAGSLLSGWAVGSPYIKGRVRHLAHHRLLGSDDDPDLDYHRTVTSGKQARRHFLLHLFGGQIVYTMFLGQKGQAGANTGDKGSILPDLIGMAVTQTGILAAMYFLIGWWAYPAIWFIPIVTLTSFFNGVRAFAEHYVDPDEEVTPATRLFTVASNPIERFFFGPMFFNYHAEHHEKPYVAAFALPALRQPLVDAGRVRVRTSYLGTMWRVCSGRASRAPDDCDSDVEAA